LVACTVPWVGHLPDFVFVVVLASAIVTSRSVVALRHGRDGRCLGQRNAERETKDRPSALGSTLSSSVGPSFVSQSAGRQEPAIDGEEAVCAT
jgi:hypothetical protein